MIGLAAGLLFAGYTLVYAAVANGGVLADHPWDALRVDAYTGDQPGAAGKSSGGSLLGRIGGVVGGLLRGVTPLNPFGWLLP